MSIGKRKSVQAVLVLMIVAAIILAGAFAWYSFTQSALNIFDGFTNPGVNVVDDYEDGKQNKDVYVQNTGEQPLYVRVRFDEYMEINGNPLDEAWNKTGYDTWHIHDYMGEQPEFCTDDHDIHTYYKWILGGENDPDGGWKYYLPTPFSHRALFDKNNHQIKEPDAVTYYVDTYADERVLAEIYGSAENGWSVSRKTAVDTYASIDAKLAAAFDDTYNSAFAADFLANNGGKAATNADYLAYLYDALDNAPNTAAIQSAENDIYGFLLENELGYYDQVWSVNEAVDNEDGNHQFDAATDLVDPQVVFVPIKRSLTTQQVYTMDAWVKAGMPSGDFWVVDSDGWCYWASVLQPGQATGLLLSEVILGSKPSGTWWYGINVSLEAATYDDINKFYGDPTKAESITQNGIMLLDMVSGSYVFDLDTVNKTPNGLPTPHTFSNNKDNTYRVKNTEDGPYDMLFVYTGTVPVPENELGKLIAAAKSPEYKVNSKFKKTLPNSTVPTEFTVTDAGTDIPYGSYGSGIIEVNGKRYIKLTYNTDKTAWLAVGPDGKFDKLTGTGPSNLVSGGDDVLIWTNDGKLPGTGYDRYTEDAPKPEASIGQILPKQIDDTDWLVLGFEGADASRKALLVSSEVLVTGIDSGDKADEIAKYKTSGANALTGMLGIDVGADIHLLTVKDAIDYFADGRARVAYGPDGKAAEWWLDDGVVSAIGNVDGAASATEAGIRVAVWISSDDLSSFLLAE